MQDSKKDTDIKNSFQTLGEGEGGMIWEKSTETCILPYVKQIASPGLMHDTGCLGLVHWDDPEGWYWEGGGRRVQDWGHMYTCGRFISYLILYMFQCHSPKSSHPLPLPQSPKDCLIHLCFFCCLVYRVIITVFLNSIYMR